MGSVTDAMIEETFLAGQNGAGVKLARLKSSRAFSSAGEAKVVLARLEKLKATPARLVNW